MRDTSPVQAAYNAIAKNAADRAYLRSNILELKARHAELAKAINDREKALMECEARGPALQAALARAQELQTQQAQAVTHDREALLKKREILLAKLAALEDEIYE